jgi:protein-tyrosine kinase
MAQMRSGAEVQLVTAPAPVTEEPGHDKERSTVQDPMLGEILHRTKGLDGEAIERALAYQRENGVRFGEAVIRLGLASSEEVMWALSKQFHYAYAASNNKDINTELVVAHRPFDDSIEVFRDLRTQLLLNGFGSSKDRAALAVVSANRGDGKTFIAANLAVAFGQLPGRTVLVDADLRSPRQHSIFDIDAPYGLTSVLSGRSDANVIHQVHDFPNLFLLPAGPMPPNPSELFSRPAFALLLSELGNKFDHVIVDTPAAEHGSDARIVASRCGTSLAIGRKGHSRLPELQRLVAQLNKHQIKIAGVVMNEF